MMASCTAHEQYPVQSFTLGQARIEVLCDAIINEDTYTVGRQQLGVEDHISLRAAAALGHAVHRHTNAAAAQEHLNVAHVRIAGHDVHVRVCARECLQRLVHSVRCCGCCALKPRVAVTVVAVAAHFAIRRMISRAAQKVAAAQLQKDAAALRAGRPLQQINASKAATSKALLQALCAKV